MHLVFDVKGNFWFKSRLGAHTFDILSEQLSKDQNTVRSVCLAVALLIGAWAYANSDQQLFLDAVGNFFFTSMFFDTHSVSPRQQLGETTSKQYEIPWSSNEMSLLAS